MSDVETPTQALHRLADEHGIEVEHRLFDDGETYYLTGEKTGTRVRFTRHWGDSQTAAEAALAALTTALETPA
jgi:hypothetical protein